MFVKRMEGRRIYLGKLATGATTAGTEFLLAPPHGTRLSEIHDLMEYALQRLIFYTVSEALSTVRSTEGEPETAAPEH